MKTVRRSVKVLLLSAVLLLGLLLPAAKAQASPTDEILNFTITVDVNDDASLDMTYHIEWKVLYDGGGKEKLEWVDLGVPNKYHENIKALSSTVKSIKDNGSKLAIYLDRGYSKNEVVTFEFSMTQDHMYQIDKWVEGETVYTFTPAWFDDFSVDELVIRWNEENAGAWQPDCAMENGYLVFTKSLSPGERFTMDVVYPSDAFGFSPDRQADGGGNNGGYDPGGNNGGYNGGDDFDFVDIIGAIIGFLIAMAFIIVPIILVVKFFRYVFSGSGFGSETKTEKKITRTKIEYYEFCPSCGSPREEGKDNCAYCGRSMIKSKEVVEESQIEKPEKYTNTGTYRYGDSPNTYIRVNVVNIPVRTPRSGGGGGTRSGGGSHHSSCASSCACASHCACASSCACACACASSGRAGCSVKDFFKESIHEGRVLIDSKRKENA